VPDWFHPVLDVYGAAILAALAVTLLWAQRRWPLREARRSLLHRVKLHAVLGVAAGLVLRLFLVPVVLAAAAWSEARGFGVLHWTPLPWWVDAPLAFLGLDYSLYLWHRLNHRLPLLWRFHQVHHGDRDLGLTTALRFHAGEMAIGALFRGAAAAAMGAPPLVVLVYEVAFQASVAFHHSNLRLPLRFERAWSRLFVGPRMHGVHHSSVRREANANYSNLLNVWDRLHGTLRLDVPQRALTIGLPAMLHDREEETARELLAQPLRGPEDAWRLPSGEVPDRAPFDDPTRLAA
jgi:sterol desaturase/sphingolipid hydroxylase (fatty acid hydroxylase superfamily)